MKKLLLVIPGLLLNMWAFGQCTPMTDFGSEPYGVAPDTIQNFSDGMVNSLYTQQIDVKVPIDGSFAGAPFITVDSAEVVSIEGLPDGLTVECNGNAATECTYLPDSVGCAIITGIPTSGGDYDLIINLTVYTTIGPYNLPFTGYHIFIDGPSAINHSPQLSFKLSNPVPNPANLKANIFITAKNSGEGLFRVYDLVGKEVFSKNLVLNQGKNKLEYNTEQLAEGLYIYRLDAFQETVTSRLVVAH